MSNTADQSFNLANYVDLSGFENIDPSLGMCERVVVAVSDGVPDCPWRAAGGGRCIYDRQVDVNLTMANGV